MSEIQLINQKLADHMMNEEKQLRSMTEFFELKLDSLADKIESGFKGVHERQDQTNGNVKKNNKFRMEYESRVKNLLDDMKEAKDDKLKRYTDLFWKVGVGVAGALGITQFL